MPQDILTQLMMGRVPAGPDGPPILQTPQPVKDFLGGLAYFPDQPMPQDAGVGFPIGAAIGTMGLPRVHPSAARIGELRGLINDVRGALTPKPLGELKDALLSRVTPMRVPHRTPLQIPKGFELPPGTSPYPSRPQGLVDKFVEQRGYYANLPEKPTHRSTGRFGITVNKEIREGKPTPSGSSLEDALLVARSSARSSSEPVKKPILGGYANRNKSHKGHKNPHAGRTEKRPFGT